MDNLVFWKSWDSQKKTVMIVALAIFGISIAVSLGQSLNGFSKVVELTPAHTTENTTNTFITFEDTGNELTVETENFLVLEAFDTGEIIIKKNSYITACVLLLIGLCLFLTALSYVKNNVVFFGGLVVVILWLASIRLSALSVFGLENNLLLICTVFAIAIPTYLFRSFYPKASIILRLSFFFLISMGLGLLVQFGSNVNQVELSFAHNAFAFPLVISVLFIITCSHSVVSTFLSLFSQGSEDKSPLNNFIKFTLVIILYLGSLITYYLKDIGVLSFSLIFLNPYVLLSISAVIGLWAFQNRSKLSGKFISFQDSGFLIYLSGGIITMSFSIFLFASSNELLEELFRTFIFYAHLAFGISFSIYSIQNFIEPMLKNIRFKERIYDPNSMAYWTVFMSAAVILTYGFGKSSSKFDSLLQGGIAQNYGVSNLYNEKHEDAEEQLIRAASRGMKSSIPNYVISNLATSSQDIEGSSKILSRLCLLNPSEFSFIGYANNLMRIEEVPEACVVLKQGLQEFPNSYAIANNLGFMYNLNGIRDSAAFYYNRAIEIAPNKESARVNLLALAARHEVIWTQSEYKEPNEKSLGVLNNYLVCSSLYEKESSDLWEKVSEKAWGEFDLALIHNSIALLDKPIDSSRVNKLYAYKAEIPEASASVNFTLLLAHYRNNELTKMKDILDEVIQLADTPLQTYYNHLGGRLFASKGIHEIAREYYRKSAYSQLVEQLNDASWSAAWSSSKVGAYNESEIQFVSALQKYGEKAQTIASCLKMQQATTLDEVLEVPESKRVLGSVVAPICYEFPVEYISSFSDKKNMRIAAIHLLDKSLILQDLDKTASIIDHLNTSKAIEGDPLIGFRIIRFWVAKKELKKAEKAMNSYKGLPQLSYLQALVANANNSSKTSELIALGLKDHPLYTPMVVMASDFYFDQVDDQDKGYEILQKAISVNQNDIDLNIAFLIRCLELEYFTFARTTLEDLEKLMSPEEYKVFADGIAPLIPELN